MMGLYWLSACFMLIVLTILFMRIWFYLDWESSKEYALAFVGMVQMYVLMDALFMQCFVGTKCSPDGFRTIVFIFYLVYVTMPYIWHLFMQSYMGISCRRSVRILEAVPLCILLGMLAMSIPTGIVWSIDGEGTYIRGALFGIFALLNLTYYLMVFIQTCYFMCVKRSGEIRYQIKSSVFSAIPLIGILVNTYVIPLYGVYPFQPYCLLVGVLLTYLFMVEHQKDQLEAEYREKLSTALEQEKESARKARAAGQVKSVFLANMSHDIRTPMNAVLGFAEVIAQDPSDEEVVRDSIAKIQMSGEMLMKIINDVLDLSRIESGKMHLEEKETDLRQIESNLRIMLEDSMKKKKLRFETFSRMPHPWVWCDETKLQQVLVNVLNNAVKFTPEGGSITLSWEEYEASEESSEYVITVRDTGIGMDETFQKNAFEAFEREHTSTESRTEGTGLGLAIVKKLVLLMNGKVDIQSKSGEGTAIILRLPFKHAQMPLQAENGKEKIESSALAGMRVLLAEDNELNADIAQNLLARAKMKVEWTKDGKKCLARLKEAEAGYYDLILMDIQMPEMDGYTAARRIRQMPDLEKSRIPIIAMTANAFEEDKRAALAAGMDGFITKPIDTAQMLKEINRICGERRE